MLDRTAEIDEARKHGRDVRRRWLHSLRGMLVGFGFTFIERPKLTKEEVKEILRRERERPEWFKTEGVEVGACSRDESLPLRDSGVLYKVTGHDPRALEPGETQNDLLKDLVHAAGCGCSGCYNRVYGRWEDYQARKREDTARE